MQPTNDDLDPSGVADTAEDTDPLTLASDDDLDFDPFIDYPDDNTGEGER